MVDGYAAALLDIASAEGDVDAVSAEIYQIAAAFDGSGELRDALTDPRLPLERKQGVVGDLLGGRASPVAIALIDLVVATGRMRDLPAIAERLVAMAAERHGAVVAEIRSATDLDADQVSRIEQRLAAVTGRRVEARVLVDASLLGGIVAKVGDTVFDGSVRGRLDDLREQWG